MSNDMLDSYSRIDQSHLDEPMLRKLLDLANSATPRPWFTRALNDDYASTLVAISTVRNTGNHERFSKFNSGEIIAATLVQNPRYVNIADEKWDENARYIVAAATVLPALIQEVIRLRKHIERAG